MTSSKVLRLDAGDSPEIKSTRVSVSSHFIFGCRVQGLKRHDEDFQSGQAAASNIVVK